MSDRWDYFAIFAGMRTGSNFLERNINSIPDLQSFGELYNPYFIGFEKNTEEFLGITLEAREKHPLELIERARAEANGLAGFRIFFDHDPRVRDAALADPRCAKIVLTRNPVETYVSWKMALATDQWVLTEARGKRDAQIRFEQAEFAAHLAGYQDFLRHVRQGLQHSGQTAFELDYTDLQDIEALDGLVRWLGSSHRLSAFDRKLKKQNPGVLRDKVENAEEMEQSLVALDPFGMDFAPVFEPARGAAVPTYVASTAAKLLYQPIRSTPADLVTAWLGEEGGELSRGMTQKTLKVWLKETPGSRTVTVLRHPVARAYTAFVEKILPSDVNAFAEIRRALRQSYRVGLPREYPHKKFDHEACRAAFIDFLGFVKSNLAGQTSLRIDPAWASQTSIVQGFSSVLPPDRILREDELPAELPALAGSNRTFEAEVLPGDFPLAEIYSPEVEKAARSAYARDYMTFGFGDWEP